MTALLTVLAYHAVGDCPAEQDPHGLWVSPSDFARQLDFLVRRRRVVPLDRVVTGVPPGKPAVAITFDDAYRSVLEHAVPLLERLSLPATVFAPTAYLGDRNRWDRPTGCDLGILGPDELRSLRRRGIEVESHGHGHVPLERASARDARADLAMSLEVLTDVLGRRPRHLAYPFSTGSHEARRVAADLGFEAAFSIDRKSEGPFARGRVPVTPLDGPRLFAVKTSGTYLQLRHNRVTQRAWPLARRVLHRVGGRADR